MLLILGYQLYIIYIMLTDLPEFRRFSVIKFDSIKREKMIDDNKDQSRWEFNADFTKEVSNY